MHNKLLTYEKFIKSEITKFESELKNTSNKQEDIYIQDEIQKLINYHQQKVHDYQHERLIHLMVTFFFAGLELLSIALIFLFTFMPTTYDFILLSNLTLAICVILFITEIFYVRYYYQLENGTQRLYALSEQLYKLLSNEQHLKD